MSSKTKQPFQIIENIETLSMLDNIEIIANQAYESNMSEEFKDSVRPHIKIVADFYGITELQTILLSALITINLQSNSVEFTELSRFFEISPITLAKHIPQIKILIDRQFIRPTAEDNRKRRRQTQLNSQEYFVNKAFYNALTTNEKYSPASQKAVDVFDLMKIVTNIIDNKDEYKNENDLYAVLNQTLDQNHEIQFVKDLKLINLDNQDQILFLCLCSAFLDDPNEEIDLTKLICFLFPDVRENMKIRKQFINNDHPLQKQELVELEKGYFRYDSSVHLTEKAWGLLVGENAEMFTQKKTAPNRQFQIIKAEDIIEKHLFYAEEEQKEIDFIIDILQPENYNNMMKRLSDDGLHEGLCMLFYGEAGTSKTQLCFNVAKATGRDIFNFKLSEAKSMYYGESQKLVKKAFDFYREMVKQSSVVPIFLMNECDGILTKRNSGNSVNQGVQQTENAIQAILLDEIENLSGIFLSTTNLQDNFDDSFYRRFIIKKKFEKPSSAEIRRKIWADKIPWLNQQELMILSKYEITGAIIENVQRKLVMQRALYGTDRPALALIVNYLNEENIGKSQQRSRIGFVK
jgi:SpoVK/Ycf46/Vps4 family AAA+-type ATPase